MHQGHESHAAMSPAMVKRHYWMLGLNLAISLAILPAALLAAHLGAEFLAIDGCLDAGRVYDYRQGVCRAALVSHRISTERQQHGDSGCSG